MFVSEDHSRVLILLADHRPAPGNVAPQGSGLPVGPFVP